MTETVLTENEKLIGRSVFTCYGPGIVQSVDTIVRAEMPSIVMVSILLKGYPNPVWIRIDEVEFAAE